MDVWARGTLLLAGLLCILLLAGRRTHRASSRGRGLPVGIGQWVVLVKDAEEQVEGLVRELSGLSRSTAVQWDKPPEIWVADLGSVDRTAALLGRLARADPLVKVIQGGEPARALETALSAGSGPLVGVIDAGWRNEPRRALEAVVKMLAEGPSCRATNPSRGTGLNPITLRGRLEPGGE